MLQDGELVTQKVGLCPLCTSKQLVLSPKSVMKALQRKLGRVFLGFLEGYHKPQDDQLFQRDYFLSLATELRLRVLGQAEKSTQHVRASRGRRYPQPSGKVSQGTSCVTTDPWSSAGPLNEAPLASQFLPPIVPECLSTSCSWWQ